MGVSEIVVMFLVYSGFIAFFLVPFKSSWNLINQQQSKINLIIVFKDSLIKMFFHKKAIFALILLGGTLFCIWTGYEGAEYHYNAHSGYSPISTDLKAIYSMCILLVYTVVLYLFIYLFIYSIYENSKNSKERTLVEQLEIIWRGIIPYVLFLLKSNRTFMIENVLTLIPLMQQESRAI